MSETRAAAERLVDRWNKYGECYPQGTSSDAYDVARAYLAEHPADDGEAVDEAWLRSVGFKRKRVEKDVACFYRGADYGTLFVYEGYCPNRPQDYWACVGKFETPETAAGRCAHFDKRLRTRGDVRRLCAALGVELKEAT